MIDFYTWTTPNGRKISIMLEEVALPYRVHAINIGQGDQFKPDYLKINPNGKIPSIVDPDGPGGKPISIFESGAILKYLALKFGQFYPTDPYEQVKTDECLFWQVGGLIQEPSRCFDLTVLLEQSLDVHVASCSTDSVDATSSSAVLRSTPCSAA